MTTNRAVEIHRLIRQVETGELPLAAFVQRLVDLGLSMDSIARIVTQMHIPKETSE